MKKGLGKSNDSANRMIPAYVLTLDPGRAVDQDQQHGPGLAGVEIPEGEVQHGLAGAPRVGSEREGVEQGLACEGGIGRGGRTRSPISMFINAQTSQAMNTSLGANGKNEEMEGKWLNILEKPCRVSKPW